MAAYLITFALAVGGVGLWTLRVTTTSRGNREASAVVSMIEATTYVVAVSHVMGSLDAPMHLVVYGLGVGSGTYAGLTIDSRLRAGRSPATAPVCHASRRGE